MSLLARTQTLQARAKRRREQEKRELFADGIRARTKNLEKHLRQLAVARARAAALEEMGLERSPWPPVPAPTFAAYDLGGSPISVDAPRQDEWETFVLALSKFVEKIEKLLAQDIKRAKKATLDGITADDLHDYLADPSAQNQVQRLLETLESLQQRNWEAVGGAELLQLLKQANTFRDEVVRQRETGASGSLLGFLALARKDGAPLTSMTDELRAELEARKLLGRLRLILR